jgi:hypothetical protein
MNLRKFGIIFVVSGLLAFVIAWFVRETSLDEEQERTRNFRPGHLSTHLTSQYMVDADISFQEECKAYEARRHDKRVAAIEAAYPTQVVIFWLVAAGAGFLFSRKERRAIPEMAPRSAPPAGSAKPAMVTCKCSACSGHIQFNLDGFDYRNPPTVTCPHCGEDTVLYIPAESPRN